MMVAAIPPNMASNSSGNIPRIVVPEAIATGMMRLVVALMTASSGFFACCCFQIDLVYQYDSVLDVHTNQT